MDDSALAIPLKDIGIKLWTWFIPLNQLSGPSMGPCKIDMLPFEILESIFLHFQADYAVDVPSPTPFKPSGPRKVAAAPVVLGAVCSHWRAVTLSIPTLWSKLWITVPRVDDITYVNRWVYRSGLHCPLDLRLDEPLSLSGSGPDPVVLSLLHTAISQDFILHALSAPSPSFLDHLTHLRMVSPVTDAHLQALTCAKGSRKPLPRLKSLVLDQCWSTDGVLSSMVLSLNKTLRSVSAVLYGSGMILDPWFTRDLALQVPGVQLDIRKG